MKRVLLFATYPTSSNGYSKVAFELANMLAQKPDIQLTYFGFQHHLKNPVHSEKRKLPENVQLYDAAANEKPGTGHGFGFNEVTEFVTINKPDVCIIYNDMVVVSAIIDQLKKVENANFKTVVYMDNVYPSQKKEFIQRLNNDADLVLCFSKYWEECVKDQGLTKPTGVIWHGFNPAMHFPVPKQLARTYFNFNKDDFIIVNLNRNQPRKRLDIMMIAFAEFISRHIEEPIKLVIGTAIHGAWNLLEIYERELKKRGVSFETGMKHIIMFDNPQTLTDDAINTLYNASDVGINTAMGEGWGLCNFEAAAIGVPQIVVKVGGFHEFFDHNSAILIEPKYNLYTDASIDGCPGCAEIADYMDFVDAFETYYSDEDLRATHGKNARKHIISTYKWKDIGETLYKYIIDLFPESHSINTSSVQKSNKSSLTSIDEIEALKDNTNKKVLKDKIAAKAKLRTSKNKSKLIESEEKIKHLEKQLQLLMQQKS